VRSAPAEKRSGLAGCSWRKTTWAEQSRGDAASQPHGRSRVSV
jgi:hypothetical protein